MSVQCISMAFAFEAPSPTTKLVLLALANYADENAQCFPPVKRIVAETGLSDRAVRNAIQLLISVRAIEKATRRRKNGTQTSDLFTLFPDGGETQTAPRAGGRRCRSVQAAPDAVCDADRLHDVPVQTAPRATLTTFEPSLEPSLAVVDARAPTNAQAVTVVQTSTSQPEDDDWPEGDAGRHAALLVEEAGTVHLDPARQPGLATTLGRLHAWRRDGASWQHDVMPVVVTLARKQRRPVGTWKFFDTAIAQSIADNRAALSIPEAQSHASPAHEHRPSAKLSAKRANLDRHYAGAEQAVDLVAARRTY